MPQFGPPTLRSAPAAVRHSIRMVGFWAAIALPLSSLLVLTVVPIAFEFLLVLLVGNVASLLVGHRYEPREDSVVAKWRERSGVRVHE